MYASFLTLANVCSCCSSPKSVDKHQMDPLLLQLGGDPGVLCPSPPPCPDSLVQVTPHPAHHIT